MANFPSGGNARRGGLDAAWGVLANHFSDLTDSELKLITLMILLVSASRAQGHDEEDLKRYRRKNLSERGQEAFREAYYAFDGTAEKEGAAGGHTGFTVGIGDRHIPGYTWDYRPLKSADTEQTSMGEELSEDELLARFRKAPKAMRLAMSDWLTLATGGDMARAAVTLRPVQVNEAAKETTTLAPVREPAAPREVTAEELGKVPSALLVKPHKKYNFAPELLADEERVKVEQSISNARKRKIRAGEPLTEEEDDRGRMAEAFVKQAGRRQLEASTPKAE
jgi:hypothetical protein